jgi:hypothetical protein
LTKDHADLQGHLDDVGTRSPLAKAKPAGRSMGVTLSFAQGMRL